MNWRQDVKDAVEQAKWYDETFTRMGGVWHTPESEWDLHMERAGVDKSSIRSRMLMDLGCGDGSFCFQALQTEALWAWGIDISGVAIDMAMARREKLDGQRWHHSHFMHGDAGALLPRFPNGSFDYVFSLGSLEHMLDIDTVLDQVRRVLRPNGTWYFYVPSEKWLHEDQPTERTGTVDEWTHLFVRHGLVPDQYWEIGDCIAFRGGKKEIVLQI